MAWIGASVTCWVPVETVAAIGRDMAVSISRHRRATGQQPTWAEALTGVNPQILTPITTVPQDWQLPAAPWRLEHRGRLLSRLKFARWVSAARSPRPRRHVPTMNTGASYDTKERPSHPPKE